MNNKQIEEIGSRVRNLFLKKFGKMSSYDFVHKITDCLHGKIIYVEPEVIFDSVLIKKDKSFIISLSSYTPPNLDVFTIAHEVGHVFLHALDTQNDLGFPRFGSNRFEWEANRFACALLMPKDEFLSLKLDDDRKAGYFGLNIRAIQLRKQILEEFLA